MDLKNAILIRKYSFYEIIYFIQFISNTFNQLSGLWLLLTLSYSEIGDAKFWCALGAFKQQIALKM